MSADTALRANVRLLGDLLGGVLVEQEGAAFLELEERIRALARGAGGGSREELRDAVAALGLERRARCCALSRSSSSSPTSPSSITACAAVASTSTRGACRASPWRRRCRARGRRHRDGCAGAAAAGSPSSPSSRRIPPRRRGGRCSPRIGASRRCSRELDDPGCRRRSAGESSGARRGDHDPLADRRDQVAAPARRRRDPPGSVVLRAEPLGRGSRLAAYARRGSGPHAPVRFGSWIGGDMDGNPQRRRGDDRRRARARRQLARELYRARSARSARRGGCPRR